MTSTSTHEVPIMHIIKRIFRKYVFVQEVKSTNFEGIDLFSSYMQKAKRITKF